MRESLGDRAKELSWAHGVVSHHVSGSGEEAGKSGGEGSRDSRVKRSCLQPPRFWDAVQVGPSYAPYGYPALRVQ